MNESELWEERKIYKQRENCMPMQAVKKQVPHLSRLEDNQAKERMIPNYLRFEIFFLKGTKTKSFKQPYVVDLGR